jgi:protein-tyrosine-phosphatase
MRRTVLILSTIMATISCMKKDGFYPGLNEYLKGIESEFAEIPEDRIQILHQLGDYLTSTLKEDGQAQLVFICTHNSRRSQFGQVWALTAAQHYGIRNIETFSGGTESTAFNPRAVDAIKRAGYKVEKEEGNTDNPRYVISSGENLQDNHMFSKEFNDKTNPDKGFCALMVCSDADEACPFVPGAEKRISMPFDDPKAFDNTDQEKAKYDERCRQIAREMFFTFRYVKTSM